MSAALSADELQQLLTVTRALASPIELRTLLAEVTAVARRLLRAERASVWLYDEAAHEVWLDISSDLGAIRLPLGSGLVGQCAQQRSLINVPDCYADPRFNAAVDRASGFHTRCSLTLPLLGHDDTLVGVLQVINREGGVFEAAHEPLAQALAAQCAIALMRARMAEQLLHSAVLQREVELAGEMQRSTLPQALPVVPGYAVHALFLPAGQTGGDTYDLAALPGSTQWMLLLADASGHGVGPALSVSRMHAMLRMALRLGADLQTAFRQVNDQLVEALPDGHFITAFIGVLDTGTHRLQFLSGGQSPILRYVAAEQRCVVHRANSFPMGAMPLSGPVAPVSVALDPGDWLVLASDGLYEWEDPDGVALGRARVEAALQAGRDHTPAAMAEQLLELARGHARAVAQDDDVTLLLLRRDGSA